jgi:hypothetical protein
MHTYIERLRCKTAARRLAASRSPKNRRVPLRDRIQTWYADLGASDRQRVYYMEELTPLFGSASSKIGPALHDLGWRRIRYWQSVGSYRRVWAPPESPWVAG